MIRSKMIHKLPWLPISLALIFSMGCGILDNVAGKPAVESNRCATTAG